MLLILVLMFSLTRVISKPTTRTEVAIYELFGDSLIAGNVLWTIYRNPWFLHGVREELFVQQERHNDFDFHCLLETAWYISLLPYCQADTFVHHIISALLAVYGLKQNITYFGFMVFAIMVWSNLFLTSSRILYYNNNPASKHVFTAFAAVYFLMRVIIFPFWFIPLMYFKVYPVWMYAGLVEQCYVINGGMLVIAGIQLVWFRKILQLIT